MNILTLESFQELLAQSSIKPRLKSELRFVASTASIQPTDWAETELVAISDRSGNKGILVVQQDETYYFMPYELKRGLASNLNGRAQPIICDFCRTWQSGSRAGSITIIPNTRSKNSVTYLCCADLACSKHVRTKTSAAHTSRSQLREDLNNEQRVERLKERLTKIINDLGIEPISVSSNE